MLIAIFSVFVPIVKFIVLLLVSLAPQLKWRKHLYLFVRNWSKWRSDRDSAQPWVAQQTSSPHTPLVALLLA